MIIDFDFHGSTSSSRAEIRAHILILFLARAEIVRLWLMIENVGARWPLMVKVIKDIALGFQTSKSKFND